MIIKQQNMSLNRLNETVVLTGFIALLKKRCLTSIKKEQALKLYRMYFDLNAVQLPLTELLEFPDVDWDEHKEILLIKHSNIREKVLKKHLMERFIQMLRTKQIVSIDLMDAFNIYLEQFDPLAINFPIELIQQHENVLIDPFKNILWTNVKKMPKDELQNLNKSLSKVKCPKKTKKICKEFIEYLKSRAKFTINVSDALDIYKQHFDSSATTLPLNSLLNIHGVEIDQSKSVINIQTKGQIKEARKFIEYLKTRGIFFIPISEASQIYQKFAQSNNATLPLSSLKCVEGVKINKITNTISIKTDGRLQEQFNDFKLKLSTNQPANIVSSSSNSNDIKIANDFIQYLKCDRIFTITMADAFKIYLKRFNPDAVILPINTLLKVEGVVIDQRNNIIEIITRNPPVIVQKFVKFLQDKQLFPISVDEAFKIYHQKFDSKAATLPRNNLLKIPGIKFDETNKLITLEIVSQQVTKSRSSTPLNTSCKDERIEDFVKYLKNRQLFCLSINDAFKIYHDKFDKQAVTLPLNSLLKMGHVIDQSNNTLEIILKEPPRILLTFIQYLKERQKLTISIDDALKMYQEHFDGHCQVLALNNLQKIKGVKIERNMIRIKTKKQLENESNSTKVDIIKKFIEYLKNRQIFSISVADALKIYQQHFPPNAGIFPLTNLQSIKGVNVDSVRNLITIKTEKQLENESLNVTIPKDNSDDIATVKDFIQYIKSRNISSISVAKAFKIYQEHFVPSAISLPFSTLAKIDGVEVDHATGTIILKTKRQLQAESDYTKRQSSNESRISSSKNILSRTVSSSSSSSSLSSSNSDDQSEIERKFVENNSAKNSTVTDDFIRYLRSSQITYITIENAMKIYQERFDSQARALPLNDLRNIKGVQVIETANIIILRTENHTKHDTTIDAKLNSLVLSPTNPSTSKEISLPSSSLNNSLNQTQIIENFIDYLRSSQISYITVENAFKIYKERFDPNAVTLPINNLSKIDGIEINENCNIIFLKIKKHMQTEIDKMITESQTQIDNTNSVQFAERFIEYLKSIQILSLPIDDAIRIFQKRHSHLGVTFSLDSLSKVNDVKIDHINKIIEIKTKKPPKIIKKFIRYLKNIEIFSISLVDALKIYQNQFEPTANCLPLDNLLKVNGVEFDEINQTIKIKTKKPLKITQNFIEYLKNRAMFTITIPEALKIYQDHFDPNAANLPLDDLLKVKLLVIDKRNIININVKNRYKAAKHFVEFLKIKQITSISLEDAFKIYQDNFGSNCPKLSIESLKKITTIQLNLVTNMIELNMKTTTKSSNPMTLRNDNTFQNVKNFVHYLTSKQILSLSIEKANEIFQDQFGNCGETLSLDSLSKINGVKVDQINNLIEIDVKNPTKIVKKFVRYLKIMELLPISIDEGLKIYRERFDVNAVTLPFKELSTINKLKIDHTNNVILNESSDASRARGFLGFLKRQKISQMRIPHALNTYQKIFDPNAKTLPIDILSEFEEFEIDPIKNMITIKTDKSIGEVDNSKLNDKCILAKDLAQNKSEKDTFDKFICYLKDEHLTHASIDEIFTIYKKMFDPSANQLPINDLQKISGVVYDPLNNTLTIKTREELIKLQNFIRYLKHQNIPKITIDDAFEIYKCIFDSTAQNLPFEYLLKVPNIQCNLVDKEIQLVLDNEPSNVCDERIFRTKNFIAYLKIKKVTTIKTIDALKIYKQFFDTNAVTLPLYRLRQFPDIVEIDLHNDVLRIKNEEERDKTQEKLVNEVQFDKTQEELLNEVQQLRITLLTKFIEYLKNQQLFDIEVNEAFKIYQKTFDTYAQSLPLVLLSKLNNVKIDYENNRIIIDNSNTVKSSVANHAKTIEDFISYLKNRNLKFLTIDDATKIYREHFDSTVTQLPIEQLQEQTNVEFDKTHNLLKIRTNEHVKLIKKHEDINNISIIIDFIQYLKWKSLYTVSLVEALNIYREYFNSNAICLPITILKQLDLIDIDQTNGMLIVKSKKTLKQSNSNTNLNLIVDQSINTRTDNDTQQNNSLNNDFINYLKGKNIYYITEIEAFKIYRSLFVQTATRLPTDTLQLIPGVEFDSKRNILTIKSADDLKLIQKYAYVNNISTIISFLRFLKCKYPTTHDVGIPLMDAFVVYQRYFDEYATRLPLAALEEIEEINIDRMNSILQVKSKKKLELDENNRKSTMEGTSKDFQELERRTDNFKDVSIVKEFERFIKTNQLLNVKVDRAFSLFLEINGYSANDAPLLTLTDLSSDIKIDEKNNIIQIKCSSSTSSSNSSNSSNSSSSSSSFSTASSGNSGASSKQQNLKYINTIREKVKDYLSTIDPKLSNM